MCGHCRDRAGHPGRYQAGSLDSSGYFPKNGIGAVGDHGIGVAPGL
jgi:hypothetical protein